MARGQDSQLKQVMEEIAKVLNSVAAEEVESALNKLGSKINNGVSAKNGFITIQVTENQPLKDLNIYGRLAKGNGWYSQDTSSGTVTITIPADITKRDFYLIKSNGAGGTGEWGQAFRNFGDIVEDIFDQALFEEMCRLYGEQNLKRIRKNSGANQLKQRLSDSISSYSKTASNTKQKVIKNLQETARKAALVYIQQNFSDEKGELNQSRLEATLKEFIRFQGFQKDYNRNTPVGDVIMPDRIIEIKAYDDIKESSGTISDDSKFKWFSPTDNSLFKASYLIDFLAAEEKDAWNGSDDIIFMQKYENRIGDFLRWGFSEKMRANTGKEQLKFILSKERLNPNSKKEAKDLANFGLEKQIVATVGNNGNKIFISAPLSSILTFIEQKEQDEVIISPGQKYALRNKMNQLLVSAELTESDIADMQRRCNLNAGGPTGGVEAAMKERSLTRAASIQFYVYGALLNGGAGGSLTGTMISK